MSFNIKVLQNLIEIIILPESSVQISFIIRYYTHGMLLQARDDLRIAYLKNNG